MGACAVWQIFNNARSKWVGETHSTYAHEGIAKPVEHGFTVIAEPVDGARMFKSLSSEGFENVTFRGEYPIATVSYSEESAPVQVEMEGYSPFIPLNAGESCFPATAFNISVRNVSAAPVTVSVLGAAS